MPAPEKPRTARVRVRPGPGGKGGRVLVFSGTIASHDVAALSERVKELLEVSGDTSIACDVGGVSEPDAAAVDALSRVQLAARRLGREIRVVHASQELLELIDLMGLRGVLSPCVESDLEARRQAE